MPTPSGLYVHIPFCRTKCPYCAFDSAADQETLIDDYIEALCDEIVGRPAAFRTFDTVYFGGGTPGMLKDDDLMRIVECIRREAVVPADAEWTIEVNPGDVGIEKSAFLVKTAGFNRISIGVQSFEQNELEFLGRRHDAQDGIDAVEDFKMTGARVCIDLIQGLPGQDVDARLRSLKKAVSLKPSHISVYELTIDPGCAFHAMGDKLPRASADSVADGYLATSKFLRSHGYIHYEVSNYCQTDLTNASRHNRRYWESNPWLGVGASAHSFDGVRRWWNVRGAADYIAAANDKGSVVAGSETLTDEQKRLERIALGFRWMGGVAKSDLRAPGLDSLLARLEREKLVIVRDDRVHATVEGFLVADEPNISSPADAPKGRILIRPYEDRTPGRIFIRPYEPQERMPPGFRAHAIRFIIPPCFFRIGGTMTSRPLSMIAVMLLALTTVSAGCGDGNTGTDAFDTTTGDIVDDVAVIDSAEDTSLPDRVEDDIQAQDALDVAAPDAEPDTAADVAPDVFTCGTYEDWPSIDNGATKFGLTMFHWNIQYVPGGLIGEFNDETISICNDMTGSGHAECEGWDDEALTDWIVRVSFQPILDLYLAHPDWRATFEMPGLMVEVITDRHPDILVKLQCAANSGQIELVSIHYSDQLFLPFPSRDLKWSIDYNRKVFEDAALPLSTVVFNQEGQSGVGKHRIMAENGYKIDVMHRNLYRYHQQGDVDDGVWPVYESTGPGATQPVKVVVNGSVDPAAGVEVDWTFFDDGEVLATPGNPYLAMFTPEPDWNQVNKFEKKLQDSADLGFMHTTITDYVARLEKLGVAPHPLLPFGDSTWQPPSTEGISRWMGRMGTLGYSLHENDNLIRTDNYKASTCLAAASVLADTVADGFGDVTAQRAIIDAGYLALIRAEVSDATGINPWMGEWVYGYNMNLDAMSKCRQAIDALLPKLGRDWAIADLDAGVIKPAGELFEPLFQLAPTDAADVPIDLVITAEGRTVDTDWKDDGRVYLLTIDIGPSDNPAGDVREKRTVKLSMPLADDSLRYSPGLVEDEITATPLADFDLFADQMYLPLANGLIGIGPDLWMVKDCRSVHLAARVSVTGTDWTVEFIDETVPAAGDVQWTFYVFKGTAEEALGFARLMNTNPNYRMELSVL